jgi:predicted nucleic acid-binding protein
MICLDTNFLIRALVPGGTADALLRSWLSSRQLVNINVIVWAEFLCGPLASEQITAAEALFSTPEPFLSADARRASELFNIAGRRRGSLTDCMIAAICLRKGASLATANVSDFRPFESLGLQVIQG